jgi:hypothetical protein
MRKAIDWTIAVVCGVLLALAGSGWLWLACTAFVEVEVISQERLKEILSYDPETGLFTWIKVRSRTVKNGSIAGCIGHDGYIDIKIDGKTYRAHRLAWFYMHGTWPDDKLDHKNGIRNDNRFENLREASHWQNSCNQKMRRNNTSGVKGVHWVKLENVWRAKITVKGKTHIVGNFENFDDAKQAIFEAREKMHGEFANYGVHGWTT